MNFKTEEHSLLIEGMALRVISVTNFDELYDQLIAKGLEHDDVADERIPYWAELWPSAVGLSIHLAKHPEQIAGKKVLEIGCGLGLPACVAAKLGGKVSATDYLQDAVDFAEKNAVANHVNGIQFTTLDWRKPDGIEPWEVLLASDVAYDRSQFEHLLGAFKLLVKPGGLILLSEPNRYIAAPFLAQLRQIGYTVEQSVYEVSVKGISSKVSVYSLLNTIADR
jgi:predicted nicotinamide N-methyase